MEVLIQDILLLFHKLNNTDNAVVMAALSLLFNQKKDFVC